MGDGNAVDYAQLGHCNVLRSGGAMRDAHLIAYRDPWPRGSTAEGAMVDDHGGRGMGSPTPSRQEAAAGSEGPYPAAQREAGNPHG